MKEIDSYLNGKSEEMLSFLEKIIRVPSGTFSKKGVDAVGEMFSVKLKRLSFDVQRIRQHQYGDHILAEKKGKDRKTLLCIGHMDTVFQEEDYSKYPFRVDQSRAFGPGILDMKGGIVLMLYAMEALQSNFPQLYEEIDLRVLLNTDEEIHSPTSRAIIEEESKKADSVCVFEPARPGGEYVTRRKGIGSFKVDVYGRSAHAGAQPELGISAIDELCRYVSQISDLRDSSSGTTINAGIIQGGTRSNVVAESAFAELDVRSFEPERIENICNRLNEMAENPAQKEAKILVSGGVVSPPMVRSRGTIELFEMIRDIGRQMGFELNETWTGGGSDGNFTSQFTPTIDGMGPQGSGSHNAEKEYILIDTLSERSIIFSKFIIEWFKTFHKKEAEAKA